MHYRSAQVLILAALWVLLGLLVIPTWGLTYWDFGDGNYLYVGQRINDGLVPYRDILAPQPPMHLLMSAISQRVGSWFGSAMTGARVYQMLLRIAASLMVYLAALRLFRCGFRAVLAAALYLALPIGFWWSFALQSENLEVPLLLLAFWGILGLNKRDAIIAGVASALAMHTNMTAVPYFVVNAIFLGFRRRELLPWYAGIGLGIWGIGALGAALWAGEPYWTNVVFNQVGSFPREEILGYPFAVYAKNKVISQSASVLHLEGFYILVAGAALAIGTRDAMARRKEDAKGDAWLRWEYAAWSAIGMCLSIGFVMKGGTMDYIFVIGEPAIAIFAADGIVRFMRWTLPKREELKELSLRNTLPFLRLLFPVLVLVGLVCLNPGVRNVRLTLNEQQAELPEPQVRMLKSLIETYTQPGDPILAPPFYAYITGRTVAAELAENYLWQIKWVNETHDGIEGEGVLKMNELGAMLRRQEVPLVLLDMEQTGQIPVVRNAIETHYQPIEPQPFPTRNTSLGLYIPKGQPILHDPILEPR
ncbi:glycosyltransferase family 39 protein [bacterium]|nr:glycosyltransferase family 39 protein [bacterium]